jgi:hypothetical protein
MKNKNNKIERNNDGGLVAFDGTRKAALEECEETIRQGFATFIEVGLALARIRDEQLYRQTHPNFGEYCRKRWNFGKTYANRLVGAAHVSCELAPIGTISHESQLRPLLKLEPALRKEAWIEALKVSQKPTQAQVRVAVQLVTGKLSIVCGTVPRRKNHSLEPTRDFTERCRAFCTHGLEEARELVELAGWCDLRDAIGQVRSSLESCERILNQGTVPLG